MHRQRRNFQWTTFYESFESPCAEETQEDTRFIIFLVNLTTREREKDPQGVEEKSFLLWKINEKRTGMEIKKEENFVYVLISFPIEFRRREI